MSEMPERVETLPEQGTGTWSRVVKEGFLEEGELGATSPVKHEDHVRSQETGIQLEPCYSPPMWPWSSLSGVCKGSRFHRSG